MALDLTGMTIDDIRNLNTRTLSTAELKQVTNRLVSASNKRMRRLLGDEYGRQSRVAKEFLASGKEKAFSTKGLKTREQIKAEFESARSFLDPAKKSHTVRGFKKVIERAESKGVPRDMFLDSNFWSRYREFMQTNTKYDSFTALAIVAQQYAEDEDMFDELYEETTDEEEDYFEDIEGDFEDFF